MDKQIAGVNMTDGTSKNITLSKFDDTLEIDLNNSTIGIENKGKLTVSSTATVKIDMDRLRNVDAETETTVGVVNYATFAVEEGGNVDIN